MTLIRHGQTEFNRVYSETRRDPGIRDPELSAVGRSQAAALAQALGAMNPSRPIVSPDMRALETTEIIAADLGLPISAFDLLPDPWWPSREESVEALSRRSEIFCSCIAREAWSRVAVVTHWGFIGAVTEPKVPNGGALRIDPSRPDGEAELLYVPGAGRTPVTGGPHGGSDDR